MPLYMVQFAYTGETWGALARQPENRAEVVSELCRSLGGRLVDLYYCFGEYDGVLLADLPDDKTATALVIAATSPGHVKATRTTRLMTVDETMEAMKKAGQVSFVPPRGTGARAG
jgi:uncharacterized protein with GYD domain